MCYLYQRFWKNLAFIKTQKAHTGERTFICKICVKSFIQKSSLTDHMQVHTGDKPHSCTICGKYYSTKGVLNRHMYMKG